MIGRDPAVPDVLGFIFDVLIAVPAVTAAPHPINRVSTRR
jgi:hypothetical protein